MYNSYVLLGDMQPKYLQRTVFSKSAHSDWIPDEHFNSATQKKPKELC